MESSCPRPAAVAGPTPVSRPVLTALDHVAHGSRCPGGGCQAWISDRGLVNCDPGNEDAPADAGRSRR